VNGRKRQKRRKHCHASGVVTRELSVSRNIPTVPMLPIAETWGEMGLAAMIEPRFISLQPMSRASFVRLVCDVAAKSADSR